MGTPTTSSPDEAGLTGVIAEVSPVPARFACTLFLGWKSSRKFGLGAIFFAGSSWTFCSRQRSHNLLFVGSIVPANHAL
jgi:hypothetical protein